MNDASLPFLPVPMRRNNGISKFNNAFSVRVWVANMFGPLRTFSNEYPSPNDITCNAIRRNTVEQKCGGGILLITAAVEAEVTSSGGVSPTIKA